MRAFDVVCNTPWAIEANALRTILEIANRENLDIAAVEAQLGRPLDNAHAVSVRDGVATIPVDGPIFRRADFFTQVSGATSIETLATDLHTALGDPAVGAILLAIDSPGGAINGVGEFAAMVHGARGTKPITAYVGHQGASAAYWIAAAADEIVVAPTALVGSIGVIAAVPDPSKTKARDIEFVSSQSPKKRPDPTTQAGSAQLQATVDDLADLFIADVAAYRGVSPETVIADFGEGGMLIGQKAVDAGLADRVGSYEGTLAALRRAATPAGWPRARAATGAAGASAHSGGEGPRGRKIVSFWSKLTRAEREEARASGAALPDEQEIGAVEAEVERRMAAERAAFDEKLAAANADRLQAEAGHKADELTRAGKLYPAQREHFIAARVQAAVDDAAHPRGAGATSRVATLDAGYELAAGHGLFGERVRPTDTARVLPVQPGGERAGDPLSPEGAAASAREYAKRANKNGRN